MKKLIALLLVLTMVIAMAACAKTETTETTETTAAPETTEAVTEAPAETEAETEAPSEEAPAVMTYEEYMAAETDALVTVETYVQGHQSWWEDKITVYCQSPEGGMFLYELACSEEDAAKLVPGTKIRVTGTKAVWNGEVEIMGGTFEFVEGGDTFVAEAKDVTELLGTEELVKHQNELVSFSGLTVEKIAYKNDELGDDIYVTLGYNGASYDFCVEVYLTGTDSDVYTAVGELKEGDVVNVEGYLYWYEGPNTHITSIAVAAAE